MPKSREMGPHLWRNNAAEASVFKVQGLEVWGVLDERKGNVTRKEGVVAEVEVCEAAGGGVGWFGEEEEEEEEGAGEVVVGEIEKRKGREEES